VPQVAEAVDSPGSRGVEDRDVARPVARSVHRPRPTSGGGGLSIGAILIIVGTALAFLGLVITMAVTTSRSRTRPGPLEKQPAAVADEDNRGAQDNLAGGDPAIDASSYPKIGPLMEPLLTPAPLRDTL
jgi:hypothetical protein